MDLLKTIIKLDDSYFNFTLSQSLLIQFIINGLVIIIFVSLGLLVNEFFWRKLWPIFTKSTVSLRRKMVNFWIEHTILSIIVITIVIALIFSLIAYYDDYMGWDFCWSRRKPDENPLMTIQGVLFCGHYRGIN